MKWELCCDLMLLGIFGSTKDFDIFYILIEEKLDIKFQNFLLNDPNKEKFKKLIEESGLTIEFYKIELNEVIKEYNIQFNRSKGKIGKEFAYRFFIEMKKTKNEKISAEWLKKRISYTGGTKGKGIGIDNFLPSDFRVGIRNYIGTYYSYLTLTLEDIFYFFVKGEDFYLQHKKGIKKSPGYRHELYSESDEEAEKQRREDAHFNANIASNFRNSYILIQVFLERFLIDINCYLVPCVPYSKKDKIDHRVKEINKFLKNKNKLSNLEKEKIEKFIQKRNFRNNLIHSSPEKENLDLEIDIWEDKTKNYLKKSLEICFIYMKALDLKYADHLFKEFNFNEWESIAKERNRIENKYVESTCKVINK